MGFFDFIFGKQTSYENEYFGKMIFVEHKKDKLKSYYECYRLFLPTNKLIEIGIEGDILGTTQKQIDFFKSIEENYSIIIKALIPLIEDEFGNWQDGFKINSFQDEFEPVYFYLPRCENEPVVWEIAFESIHDRNHLFTFTMYNFEARELHIDG